MLVTSSPLHNKNPQMRTPIAGICRETTRKCMEFISLKHPAFRHQNDDDESPQSGKIAVPRPTTPTITPPERCSRSPYSVVW